MKNKQGGAVLAVSLMILLILTILVLTGNRSVLLQEKMTEAVLDGHISLQVTESALLDAEAFIDTLVTTTGTFVEDGTGGLYAQDSAAAPSDVFAASAWAAGKFRTASSSLTHQGKEYTAIYYIEELAVMDEVDDSGAGNINMMGYGQTTGGGSATAFRVVARSQGNGNAERIVEAHYGKRL